MGVLNRILKDTIRTKHILKNEKFTNKKIIYLRKLFVTFLQVLATKYGAIYEA